ncbi:MAG: MFS transporter [Spirochaetales bacterium]|nr:MFS transporter [Spirochaetales bacterium]MCF7939813.1 MFS transporter [Spirochaetales bacterium]
MIYPVMSFAEKAVFPQGRIKLRLSIMFYLHFFAAGATIPIMSLYLRRSLEFSGGQIGTILAMSALSAFLAPVLAAFVTDRLVSAERMFAFLHLFAAAMMFLFTRQTEFFPALLFYLFYMLAYGPCTALTTSISLHHAPDARRDFGGMRLWGTAGWVSAGWLIGLFWLRYAGGDLRMIMLLSAGVSLLLGLYSMTLPGSGGTPRRSELVPRAALRILIKPQMLLVVSAAFLVMFVDKYYYFGTAPYLKSLGVSDNAVMPMMSAGQITEIVSLALLGMTLHRFGYLRTLLLGALMETARFAFFTFGQGPVSAVAGICFHGPAFAFFFSAAFVYVNSFSGPESRAGVQQLFSVIYAGLGGIAGNMVAGMIFDVTVEAGAGYRYFWMAPLGIALLAAGLLLIALVRSRRRSVPG